MEQLLHLGFGVAFSFLLVAALALARIIANRYAESYKFEPQHGTAPMQDCVYTVKLEISHKEFDRKSLKFIWPGPALNAAPYYWLSETIAHGVATSYTLNRNFHAQIKVQKHRLYSDGKNWLTTETQSTRRKDDKV